MGFVLGKLEDRILQMKGFAKVDVDPLTAIAIVEQSSAGLGVERGEVVETDDQRRERDDALGKLDNVIDLFFVATGLDAALC